MNEIIDTLNRWKNWVRIKYLELFTDRVRRISIKDDKGKEHGVVIEKQLEKVCSHKTITEIATTLWKCTECDTYFQINYKVQLTYHDLINYIEKIADHLKVQIMDKE